MSFHKTPKYQIPALIEALKLHHFEHDTPSQLSDVFRIGWMAAESAKDAEIAALRQDALRYQVLRDAPQQDQGIYVWDQRGEEYEDCGRDLRGAELDAALDAAMAQAVQPTWKCTNCKTVLMGDYACHTCGSWCHTAQDAKPQPHSAQGVILRFGSIHEHADGRLVFSGFHCDGADEHSRVDVAVLSLVIARLQAELAKTVAAQAVQPL